MGKSAYRQMYKLNQQKSMNYNIFDMLFVIIDTIFEF